MRVKTKNQQGLSDKLSEMRRTQAEVWVTVNDRRIKIRPLKPGEAKILEHGSFVYKHRAKLHIGDLGRRKGTGPFVSYEQGCVHFYVRDKNVLAVIVEDHPRGA